jgi:hypothetical protein
MTRNAYTVPAAPTCIVRGCDRDASFDIESRGYFQKCDECAMVGVEHCVAAECLVGGHTWLLSEVRIEGGVHLFTCPSCGFDGDRLAWARRSGAIGGSRDAARGEAWLVEGRRAQQEKNLRDAWTPNKRTQWGAPSWASIEYARAYLAATA